MNLFHPIKSPFDFSHDNGYFHTEHLAFLITKQTTTLQGNHFKVIITRLSSPINPITMTQPRKNTIWARGSSLLQTASKEETSYLFFSKAAFEAVQPGPFDSSVSLSSQSSELRLAGDAAEHPAAHEALQPLQWRQAAPRWLAPHWTFSTRFLSWTFPYFSIKCSCHCPITRSRSLHSSTAPFNNLSSYWGFFIFFFRRALWFLPRLQMGCQYTPACWFYHRDLTRFGDVLQGKNEVVQHVPPTDTYLPGHTLSHSRTRSPRTFAATVSNSTCFTIATNTGVNSPCYRSKYAHALLHWRAPEGRLKGW